MRHSQDSVGDLGRAGGRRTCRVASSSSSSSFPFSAGRGSPALVTFGLSRASRVRGSPILRLRSAAAPSLSAKSASLSLSGRLKMEASVSSTGAELEDEPGARLVLRCGVTSQYLPPSSPHILKTSPSSSSSDSALLENPISVDLPLGFALGTALKRRKELPMQNLGKRPHPLVNP